jgi:hypothetical protein
MRAIPWPAFPGGESMSHRLCNFAPFPRRFDHNADAESLEIRQIEEIMTLREAGAITTE